MNSTTLTHLKLHWIDPIFSDDAGPPKSSRAAADIKIPAGRAASVLSPRVGAKLATESPLSRPPAPFQSNGQERSLSARLEAILRSAAQATGCAASGLYLLNDATSELALRAAWQLPFRELGSVRELRGAAADLQALTGHAIAIDDTSLLKHWRIPENFPAALCVPVATLDLPLGTLWAFAELNRDFSALELGLWEMAAGRIATELERADLARELAAAAPASREVAVVNHWRKLHSRPVAPEINGWEIAKCDAEQEGVPGWSQWQMLENGSCAVLVGRTEEAGLTATMSESGAQSAIAAHCEYQTEAGPLCERINETLWRRSPGGESLSLALACIESDSDEVRYVLSGDTNGFVLRDDSEEILVGRELPLGVESGARFQEYSVPVAQDETLVLFQCGSLSTSGCVRPVSINTTHLARMVRPLKNGPTSELAAAIRRHLVEATRGKGVSVNVVVLRRQG